MSKGKLIVLEGPDGCGKSTHVSRLARWFDTLGLSNTWTTSEPYATHIGDLIKKCMTQEILRTPSWAAMALLFAADRMEHCKTIGDALEEGRFVICDRYYLSSIIYQCAWGNILNTLHSQEAVKWVREINKYAIKPDLTIILNAPAQTLKERLLQRETPKTIYDNDQLHNEVIEAYKHAEDYLPDEAIVYVDASYDKEVTHIRICHAVSKFFGLTDKLLG